VKFERARSIHLQASNHRGPAAAGASPVSVLTSTQQGATASRADRQIFRRSADSPAQAKKKKKKTWPSRTTCCWRVASPAYSFGPGVATATRSRAAPRSTTRSPTQTCYTKKKKNRTSLHFRSPGRPGPVLCSSVRRRSARALPTDVRRVRGRPPDGRLRPPPRRGFPADRP
jgi:hypothetical protein